MNVGYRVGSSGILWDLVLDDITLIFCSRACLTKILNVITFYKSGSVEHCGLLLISYVLLLF